VISNVHIAVRKAWTMVGCMTLPRFDKRPVA
jgi:hypothetical protein